MKNQSILQAAVLLGLGLAGGYGLGLHQAGGHGADHAGTPAGAGACPDGAAPEYWVAPMDASYRRDAPGLSPMGMDLVPFCGASAGADVRIEPAVAHNLGLRTATVMRGPLELTVQAAGTVAWDEASIRMLHTRAEGWLQDVAVASVGEHVSADALLYRLFAPELVAAERELLAAGRQRSMRESARDRLGSLGYTAAQIAAVEQRGTAAEALEVRSPAALSVLMLNARPGQFVTPGSHVMTLADPAKVWLLLDVAERDAARVRTGQSAVAEVDAWPGRQWQARVDFIYPELDRQTRTQRLRLVVDNADGALRPGMYAGARIHGRVAEAALLVPSAAVIRGSQGPRVVKALGDGGFDVVAVRTGALSAGQTQVLSGLEAGDQVVTSGQFLIDSEANVDAEALRLTLVAGDAPSGHDHSRHEHAGQAAEQKSGHDHAAHEHAGRAATKKSEHDHSAHAHAGKAATQKARHGGSGHDHDSHDHGAHGQASEQSGKLPPKSQEAPQLTAATVRGVFPAEREITLEHGFIESLGMPAMTMGFVVAPQVPLENLKPGDRILFAVDNPEQGVYRVTRVEPAP